ncbi:MAG TPA: acetyl-CoA carboxylase, carboxyltransferase subunit beta [Bacillota bacterium]
MLKDLFRTKPKYVTVRNYREETARQERDERTKKDLPDGLWVKCENCHQIIYHKDLEQNLKVCPKCDYHFRIGAKERLRQLLDEGSFEELFAELSPTNPLNFPNYEKRLSKYQKETGLKEGVLTGAGKIEGIPVAIAVMDFFFMGGSMGSVVGEKIANTFEYAAANHLPMITVSASGGARMQEGILSLMQMAKTCQARNLLAERGLVYISVLTDPTSGGVYASFASQGDINMAEPGAYIGFAGTRVIEQTIRQTLPEGFQKSEFLLQHGVLDLIVHRKEVRKTLARLLRFHQSTERAEVNG